MSKQDDLSINKALQDFISKNKLQEGIDKIDIKTAWKTMMGNAIANYTTQIDLRGDTLFVRLSSSVLREELSYGKEKIIKNLNEALGKELITKLILQ